MCRRQAIEDMAIDFSKVLNPEQCAAATAGDGPILVEWAGGLSGGKPTGEAVLALHSPEAIVEGRPMEMGIGGVLVLDFDDAIVVSECMVRGKTVAPGTYTAKDGWIRGRGSVVVCPLADDEDESRVQD